MTKYHPKTIERRAVALPWKDYGGTPRVGHFVVDANDRIVARDLRKCDAEFMVFLANLFGEDDSAIAGARKSLNGLDRRPWHEVRRNLFLKELAS